MTRGPGHDPWQWSRTRRVALSALAMGLAVVLGTVAGDEPPDVPAPPLLVVDPNSAPRGVLDALPRVGPSLAARIAAERARRPFRSLDDLDVRVRGVGPATVRALRPHLRVPEPADAP